MSSNKLGYSYILGGPSNHRKHAVDIIGNEVENLFNSKEWYSISSGSFKNNPVLELDERPTADIVSTGLIFGLIAFAGDWAGNKALDELYEHKIKPAIIKLYKEVNEKSKSESSLSFEYQDIVWYEEHKVLVVVRMKVKSEQEIDNNFELIHKAHKNALKWIMSKGIQAPVHEYTIENKIVNVNPNFYSSLKEIQTEERMKSIKKLREVT